MEAYVGNFILTYLLMPIIALILGILLLYIAKKNGLTKDKKTIFFCLALWVILALPAIFGLIDYWFMPYVYQILLVVYLILGVYIKKFLKIIVPEIEEKPFYIEFIFTFVTLIISMGLFTLLFNLCNELQYGIWASTSLIPLLFPCIFRKAYSSFLNIPLEVYKVWNYHEQMDDLDSDLIDYSKVLVVEIELFKNPVDNKAQNIKAKSSEDLPFGAWFKIFIEDYNKRTPHSPVVASNYENSYGWIFYITSSVLGRKKYIDPDLTFAQNKIQERNVIIAKRTMYNQN